MDKTILHISIHAPRTGSDETNKPIQMALAHFNPRSPHGERQDFIDSLLMQCGISIHAPRTGSDRFHRFSIDAVRNFNPRSPHGERPGKNRRETRRIYFNPRSPHGERPNSANNTSSGSTFQSTLPARGATRVLLDTCDPIHQFQSTLPARGATRSAWRLLPPAWYFNPRSPHGERRANCPGIRQCRSISIHAPRTGSDTTRGA